MIVRLAVDGDVEAILALTDAVAAERLFIGPEPGYDRELFAKRLNEKIARPEHSPLFVAINNAQLVGVLSIEEHSEYGPTLGMLVAPQTRRRGIGRALLDRAIEWGRQFRMTHLSLLVFPHNEGALHLYRTAGFVEIERYERDVTRQNGEVWDSLLMRKDLCTQ